MQVRAREEEHLGGGAIEGGGRRIRDRADGRRIDIAGPSERAAKARPRPPSRVIEAMGIVGDGATKGGRDSIFGR